METDFTPVASLVGGMMIGAAAVLLMAFNGRVAGISGILGRVLTSPLGDRPGLMFVLGLVAATPLYLLATGAFPAQTVSDNLPLMAVAGLLVGLGSAIGNGCTSGHGVCGLSRLSRRSITATAIFMVVAAITVLFTRHVL